jgi:hypothetical protein
MSACSCYGDYFTAVWVSARGYPKLAIKTGLVFIFYNEDFINFKNITSWMQVLKFFPSIG